MSTDRRREDRLVVSGVSLWIKHDGAATICEVLNLSRLGVCISIPEDALHGKFPALQTDLQLDATIKIGVTSIPVGLKVTRMSGQICGCSFVFPSADSQKKIFEALSPRFVAQSLMKIAEKSLNANLKYAYFGNDFSIVSYSSGERFKISVAGREVVIEGEKVTLAKEKANQRPEFGADQFEIHSFVPHPEVAKKELIDWVIAVLSVWESPPDDVAQIVKKLRAYHAA